MPNRILRTTNGYSINQLEATGLPPREAQVLLLKALGLTTQAVALELHCAARTVRGRLENLFYKFGAKNSAQLIGCAFISGHLKNLALALVAVLTLDQFAGALCL